MVIRCNQRTEKIMKRQPNTFNVSIDVDGTVHEAMYTVSSNVVAVESPYGSGSTQVGGLSASTVARMLLREIIAGAKERGEL